MNTDNTLKIPRENDWLLWRLSTDGSLVCEDEWPSEPADENYDYAIHSFPIDMEIEEVAHELRQQGYSI